MSTRSFSLLNRPSASPRERGFTLAAVLVLITILGVTLAYTVIPLWSTAARRDRDRQTIFAMKQYARAVREFQRKRGVFPVSLAQLKEQNNPRVARALYPNPLSGEMDWILVPVGTATPPPAAAPSGRSTLPTAPAPPPPQPASGAVGAFIGVRPPNQGKSVVKFREKERYEEWYFTINELPGGTGFRPASERGY